MKPGLPPNTPKSELTLSAGGERRRQPDRRPSAYRDCAGFDEVCECGTPLTIHPDLPKPLPWSHGRPCGKAAVGQFASGSSFLQRNVRVSKDDGWTESELRLADGNR